MQSQRIEQVRIDDAHLDIENLLGVSKELAENLILVGAESNQIYNFKKEEIRILKKNGEVKSLSEFETDFLNSKEVTRHFMCFPKYQL